MMLSTNPLTNLLGGQAALPLLTAAQEVALAHRVANGQAARKKLTRQPTNKRRSLKKVIQDGLAAREALILHNLPLVISVAGRYRHSALAYEDLIQEGVLGLLKAAERYDPRRGTRFGTLAVWWIRQSIGRAIANTGRLVRLPVNRAWKIGQLRRMAMQLAQKAGEAPNVAQVAEAAGVPVTTAEEMLRDGQEIISLDTRPTPDEREALERLADETAIDPEERVLENSLKHLLNEALARLDEREAQILRLRFGLGGEAKPLRAIATAWRMSPEGVRQISERALTHLRNLPRVKELAVFLED